VYVLTNNYADMFCFALTARDLYAVLGCAKFLRLYFGALFASAACSIAQKLGFNNPNVPSLGASGAIAGLMISHSLTFPWKFTFVRMIPMPSAVAGALFVSNDVLGFVLASQRAAHVDAVDHAAHLGGALVAVMFALIMRRSVALRQQLASESTKSILSTAKRLRT